MTPSTGTGRALVVSHEATRTGAPRVAVEVIRALGEAGWDTHVLHRWGGPLRPEMDAAAAASHRERLSAVRAALQRTGRHRATASLAARVAGRAVRTIRPDLVWGNTATTAAMVGAARDRAVPAVLHVHESDDGQLRRLLRRLGGTTHGISFVACSDLVAERLSTVIDVPPERIVTVPSAVDVAGVRRRAGAPVRRDGPALVVACGLGTRLKGLDVFADAARLARGQGLDARFRWVGRVADPVVDLTGVELAGEVADAAAEIAAADVFVLPSRFDSFPLVVLEAMALSVPIVSADLAGVREQTSDDAWFVEPADPKALVDAIGEVLASPDVAARRAASASRRCEQLWDVARFRATVAEVAAKAAATS